ncbi:IclR family transcriptional regulator [Pararhizobium haloflavum]|uniref:IclR family transcriptional regulator n=1 Tax=Pararhizobium haloflavum TaxID=2037914 RepID=UPI000C193967|nr:IclR family transcriptional regulator [Pararhizobium haloflavum]
MAAQINGSVVKAFQVLKLFSEARTEITASEVASELHMNGVTAHRFLRTLQHVGAIIAVSKGVYRLGYVFADLGDRVLQNDALAHYFQPRLNAMTAEIKEATMATVFRSDMVFCIARAVSTRSLSVDIRVGTQLEAYCTAHGKLWLAHMPEHDLRRYLQAIERKRFTDTTLIDPDALEREIDAVRARGHAINNCEREDGIKAIAVPVLTRTGKMIAGLSAFGPASRFTDPSMMAALGVLQCAASSAERDLYGEEGL